MIRKFIFICCILCTSLLVAIGNNPIRFTHYSTLNGLPNDYVQSIVQDPNGFIWFATHIGIVRFDGHNFKIYQPNPQKPNSLSYKHTNQLYCDLRGNIWIRFTENALNRFDPQTDKFYNYNADSAKADQLKSTRVTCFFEDRDSTLFIGTYSGLYKYNYKLDNFTPILPKTITPNTTPSNYIRSVISDNAGNICFASTNGIGIIQQNQQKIKSLGQIFNRPDIDDMSAIHTVNDQNSNIWFATNQHGVFYFNLNEKKTTQYISEITHIKNLFCSSTGDIYIFSSKDNSLYFIENTDLPTKSYKKIKLFDTNDQVNFSKINEDKSGSIWISSSHGLDKFTKETGITHYLADPFKKHSLSSNLLNLTFVDNNNNLWVSNYRRGLDKADLNQKPFQWNYTNTDQSNNIFLGTNITSVLEDSKGYLWVGSAGNSIIRIDRSTDSICQVQIKASKKHMFSALFEDSEGDIWVGNYSGKGIDRINSKTLEITFSTDSSGFNGKTERISGVRKFIEDQNKDIWFTSISGIHKWKRSTQQVIAYSGKYDKHNPDHGFYRTIMIDKDGIIWSGSYNGGLARYDTKKNKVKRFLNRANDKTSISGNGVYAIYEETDSTFLVGTTIGLNRFNKNTELFSLIKTQPSTYNYSIYAIIPDTIGNYWLATDNGLIRLNKQTHELTIYNEGDGLLTNEFNTTASIIDKNGRIYIGSPKGLLSFDPTLFTKNPFDARPTITNVQVHNITISPGDSLNNRILLNKQIWLSDTLELKYYENDFTLQFSGMHYAAPENNKFWYKLEGFNEEWITTDANRRWASFTGLPPGEYLFRLRASNNDGKVCEKEAILNIIIHPPFWVTTWFKIVVILLIAALVGIFLRLRILRLKKLTIYLEHEVDNRTKKIQEANYSLQEQQEEINVQKESLIQTNEILTTTQNEIIEKNNELAQHRNKLEELVKARTIELSKALKKARESDQLKTSFLANMSHEIRTPMNAIIGFSSLLKNKELTNFNKNRYINTIIKNSNSLLVLIDDILDLSKIQSNQLKITLKEQNLISILNEIHKTFSTEAIEKGISLNFNKREIDCHLKIITDEVRFKQVFSNLISNAIKFTNKGYVEFGIVDLSTEVTFYIKDTGIGIPAKAGNSIFERFMKLEDDIKHLYRGAGLGLAISKSIVAYFGGKIWYESTENSGTTFYFTHSLKLNPTITEYDQDNIQNKNLDGKTILIAEDEESNFEVLKEYLIKTGAKLIWAQNGIEACQYADSNTIDLILMDIKMPIMGGIEASKAIKTKHPQLCIIAQTAFSHTDFTEFLKSKIIDSVIIKPIKKEDLLKIINKSIT